MADHRCPACGAGLPRGAGFCPACGTAVNAAELPIEHVAVGVAVSEHEVALGARRPNPKRSALVVGALAVVVLGGGLIAGAGGGGDERDTAPTLTTAAPRPTTTERTGTTRTTVRRTTTSSTLPTFVAEPIPELGGAPLYAVVADRIVRLDTATGESTVLAEGSRGVAQRWSALIARTGGVVVADDSTAFVPDDGSPPVLLGTQGQPVWPAADPSRLWVINDTSFEPVVDLVDVTTGDPVATLPLPLNAFPVGDDATGRLLVEVRSGGTYALDPTTGAPARFSTAHVVAATARHYVELRCDDVLVCRYHVIDGATGQATGATHPAADAYADVDLDPSGTRLALTYYGPNTSVRMAVVDLASGSTVELSGEAIPDGPPNVSWTADGRYLVLADDGAIVLWAPGADAPIVFPIVDGDGDSSYVSAVAVGV